MVIPNEGRLFCPCICRKDWSVRASFKAPAKGVRFDLRSSKREWLLENADWAGGYLQR